jgi:3-hydroxybutyryl-CoA dehydrogenase
MALFEIQSAAVIGTGLMGQGIAELLTGRGVRTVLLGRSETSTRQAAEAIAASRALALRRKQVEAAAAEAAAGLLQTATDPQALAGCDLVIETVVEDLDVKREVLRRVCPACRPGAVVATNTSALRAADISQAVPDRTRFLGMHFMNPAPVVNLVELVPTAETAIEVMEAARAFCRRLGRQVVESKDEPGFVVNRLLMLLLNEAARMIEEGVASPADIDKAMKLACGHPMGPVALADFIGLDTVSAELQTLAKALGNRYAPAELLRKLVADGKTGRKAGKGLAGFRGPL